MESRKIVTPKVIASKCEYEIRIQIHGEITRKAFGNERNVVEKKIEQNLKLENSSRRRQVHQNQCQKVKNKLHVFTSLGVGLLGCWVNVLAYI